MPIPSHNPSKVRRWLTVLALAAAIAAVAWAHPGTGIAIDSQGQIYFVDTGQGVWKLDRDGKLTLFHTLAYHWMALDEKGRFARSQALGNLDRGSFERITSAGAVPAFILSSDYPIAIADDGGLYYVLHNNKGKRELVRRMPDGTRSIVATLPDAVSPEPMLWVNGIAAGPNGSVYVTDNDAILKIDRSEVSTFRDKIRAPDCTDPLPDVHPPHLRGLAVAPDGTVYVAASGCRAVIAIPPTGAIRTVLKAENPWAPTGIALSGRDVYVLEYLHTRGDDRKEWIPRVRKVDAAGKVTTLATIKRR